MTTEATAKEAASFTDIESIYERYRKEQNIPGVAFGIVKDGRLVHAKGLGMASIDARKPAIPETFFRIASMTKVVTALAILLLRDRSALTLDATVTSLVPGFTSVRLPTADSRPITLRDLLTHVGGLVTDDPWGDRHLGMPARDFDGLLAAGLEFARPPRLGFEYANLGYALLGRAIAGASGEPYSEFVRRELLVPLGMVRTTFQVGEIPEAELAMGYRHAEGSWSPERLEPDGAFGAMGGLTTNAVEYARFIAFLLDAWPARDDPETGPVARASRRELAVFHSAPQAATLRNVGGREIATAGAYGYGIVNSIDPVLGRTLHHRGGLPGYGSHFLISPETGVGLFGFGNRTYAAMNEPNLEAATVLKEAGLWAAPPQPVSGPIAVAVEAVSRIYRAGRIGEARALLADNFLLDRPEAECDRLLAGIATTVGELRHIDAVPVHNLAAKLVLVCERGTARGEIILTAEQTPRIQALELEAVASPPSGDAA